MDHNSFDREDEEKYFDEAERANFIKVIASFKNYRKSSLKRIDERIVYISSLPKRQQNLLENYKKTLTATRQCVEQNQFIIEKFLNGVDNLFVNSKSDIEMPDDLPVTDFDNDNKVSITLKQIVRDWTDLGFEERQQSYKPILDELAKHFDINEMKCNQFRILNPGSGLGRLVYEIAQRGFYCEGNEFSLFMLIASNFLLNRCLVDNAYEIFPYCHQFSNNFHSKDPLISCTFPDVSTFHNPPKGEMNMIAGDFIQVYSPQSNEWDCVVTCFFIDCANNVVDFIEIIHKILKEGGIWINLGPLLYHFCDVTNEYSIEPSYEDVHEIIEKTGFEFLKEDTNVRTKYSQNALSMAHLEYSSVFFVVKKKTNQASTFVSH